MPKDIVLFDTAVGTSNLGDEVIFESVKRELSDVLDAGNVMRLGTHTKNYSLRQKAHNPKYDFAKNAHLKLIAGTNLLLNSVFLHNTPQFQLSWSNRDIYQNAVLVGVGTTTSYKRVGLVTRSLYRSVFSKDFIHSARDEHTREIIDDLGLRSVNTGCPTLWCMNEERCKKIPTTKATKVVVAVSGYPAQRDMLRDRLMVDVVYRNYAEVFFWAQTIADEPYFASLANGRDYKSIYSLRKFEKILDQGDIDYVGTRLHGGVFALQHACRTIMISIDKRMDGIKETQNIPAIPRKDMANLDDLINGRVVADIKIPQANIDLFLSQFL